METTKNGPDDAEVPARPSESPQSPAVFPQFPPAISTIETLKLAAVPDGRQGSARSNFYVRCKDNQTAIFVQFPGQKMSGVREYSEMIFRVDGKEKGILEFDETNSSDMLTVWEGYRAVPFLKALEGSKDLTFDALASNGRRLLARFDITTLDAELVRIRNACNW